MSTSIVVAKIATLRFCPEGKTSGAFNVRIAGPTTDISSSFQGAGEVEMNEVTFECTSSDTLIVTVNEGDSETHKVEISMENIQAETDWSILQVENFEVRIQFLVSTPLPADFLENAFDIIGGPKAWYFKADELYALIKTVAQQLKLPSQLGVTSEQVVEKVSKLVDMASEAVLKRFSTLSAQEELNVLQKLDELLTTQFTVFDSMVDSSRVRLVESLRKLKASLEENLRLHKQYVERTVESTKERTTQAINDVNTSVDAMTLSAKASIDGAKGKAETYKTYVHEQVESVKGQLQQRVASVQGEVTVRVTALSDESKQWATEFLNARVVQGKGALDKAQPYVVQAVGATEPYASRVAIAAKPYVDLAMPYVEGARKMAEENQYVGPYVAPVLNTANQLLDQTKQYMGLSGEPAVAAAEEEKPTGN